MFAYLRGKLVLKNSENVVIDVGGVGYSLQTSYSTYTSLPDLDSEVKLYN